MNIKTAPFLALLIALITFGCEPTTKEIADNLEKELIAEHDIAMAKMEHVQHTMSVLNKERTEFMLDSASHHAAHLEECDKSIVDLEAADKAMMDWMHQYAKASKETRTDDERIKFYEAEMVKIKAVNELIHTSVKEGEHFVRKFYIDKADHQKEVHQHEHDAEVIADSTNNKDVEV